MAKPIAKVSQLMSKFNANMAQENTHCRDFATSFLMAAPPSIAAVTLVQLDQAIAQVRHAFFHLVAKVPSVWIYL